MGQGEEEGGREQPTYPRRSSPTPSSDSGVASVASESLNYESYGGERENEKMKKKRMRS